jgi:hypothetical protein
MGEVLGGSKSTVSRLETGDMRLDETRAEAIGFHPGLDESFMILRLADPFGEAAYVEAPGGGRLVPNIDEVASFALRYERIGQHAAGIFVKA